MANMLLGQELQSQPQGPGSHIHECNGSIWARLEPRTASLHLLPSGLPAFGKRRFGHTKLE